MSVALIFFWSLVCWLVLDWPRHSERLRGRVQTLLLLTGIVSIAVAPFLRGSYLEEVALYIAGPNAYPVETVERSYSGLALGIGLLFLALAALPRWGHRLPGPSLFARALWLTGAVVAARVWLEKLGVPLHIAMAVGIIWLAFPLPVFFAREAAREGSSRTFWRWLFGYAYGIRLVIVVIMLITTHFALGTHFDNSAVTRFDAFGKTFEVEARSWEQYLNLIIGPQLLLWPTVTLVAGVLLGLPSYLYFRKSTRET